MYFVVTNSLIRKIHASFTCFGDCLDSVIPNYTEDFQFLKRILQTSLLRSSLDEYISLRYTQVLALPGKWDVRSKFGLLYSLGELAQCRVYDNVPSGLVSLAEDVPIR